ncbi:hypothetical protein AGMMS49975_14200 [Clostridia bacterium]|nr:hypothetical protein AGMMS49975_14200 [Clostridia bacterium]
MKLGKTSGKISRPAANAGKQKAAVVMVLVIAGLLIAYVQFLGNKAQETIQVVMFKTSIYKNGAVTEEKIAPYEMLLGEYEKYSVVSDNGVPKRRVVTWDERGKIIGTFAAYPLQQNTVAMYRDFIKSRLDNSDTVMYAFPGKSLVPLQADGNSIEAFKTFLQPSDRLNIEAVYTERVKEQGNDIYGNPTETETDIFKTETVFDDVLLADLLNQQGSSILDMQKEYNDQTVWRQAQLDSDPAWKAATKPSTALLALTPEELTRYYYFLAKQNVKFKISLPQRDN